MMSLHECNMHVENLAHGSLGHAIELDRSWAVTCHSMFNIQLIKGPCGMLRVT